MSRSRTVKSPTSNGVVPTSVLAPLVLMRTWSRSGNCGTSTVRVAKFITAPSCNVTGGVRIQLLIVVGIGVGVGVGGSGGVGETVAVGEGVGVAGVSGLGGVAVMPCPLRNKAARRSARLAVRLFS